ncbi:MAG: hypothetical protein JSW27_25040 [Phycisphaerales bacterium]|nr:MAG: hypothetical protein JSW27_25040 [Phycisphaerales bacterium]
MDHKNVSIFKVMFCGPGDVESEGLTCHQAVDVCSKLLETAGKGVTLAFIHWKSDPVIQNGPGVQPPINEQLVGSADALVAAFRSRLGSATGKGSSGTVQEIERAIQRGICWRAYFYNGGVTVSDASQLAKLYEYKKSLQEREFLTVEYESPMELLLDLVKWLFKVFCSEGGTPDETRDDTLLRLVKVHDRLSRSRSRQLANVLYTIAGTQTDALRILTDDKPPRTFVQFARQFGWKVEVLESEQLRKAIAGPLFEEDVVPHPSYTMWKKIPLARSKKQPEPTEGGYLLLDDTEPKTVYVDKILLAELNRLLEKLR